MTSSVLSSLKEISRRRTRASRTEERISAALLRGRMLFFGVSSCLFDHQILYQNPRLMLKPAWKESPERLELPPFWPL
jgi:hypothetical protein